MSNPQTALAVRLAELEITAEELTAILRNQYPLEVVEQWIDGTAEPDPEAKVHLRLFFDPERQHAAELAAEKIRHTFHRTYAGGDRDALSLTRRTMGPEQIDGAHYGEASA